MSLDGDSAFRLKGLIDGFLDRGYERTARSTLDAIGNSMDSGIVDQRINELNAHSARLEKDAAKAGLPIPSLQPDDPVLNALINDLEPVMVTSGDSIAVAGPGVQQNGIDSASTLTRQMALPGFDDAALSNLGITWNVPDPEAVNSLVGYVQSDAWADELVKYGDDVVEIINQQAIIGIARGQGAHTTSQRIQTLLQGAPGAPGISVSEADKLMRTLQIQSYQSATAINNQANSEIVTGQIRIEALDDRTCLACISLHGTDVPMGQKAIDHHNGRATTITTTRLVDREVESGADWFARQPRARQEQIAGPANLKALESGKVALSDYVEPYDDPVFGQMQREKSLVNILGAGAAEFK